MAQHLEAHLAELLGLTRNTSVTQIDLSSLFAPFSDAYSLELLRQKDPEKVKELMEAMKTLKVPDNIIASCRPEVEAKPGQANLFGVFLTIANVHLVGQRAHENAIAGSE